MIRIIISGPQGTGKSILARAITEFIRFGGKAVNNEDAIAMGEENKVGDAVVVIAVRQRR